MEKFAAFTLGALLILSVPTIAFASDPFPISPDAEPVPAECAEPVDGVAIQEYCPSYMVTQWTLVINFDTNTAVYAEERCELTREFERSVTFAGSGGTTAPVPILPVDLEGSASYTETEMMCTYGDCGTFNFAGVPGGLFGHSGQ